MSSSADFDRTLKAGVDLFYESRTVRPGLRPQPQDAPNSELITELMDDMKDEETEYATFDDDKPYLSVRQRVLCWIVLLMIIFAAGWVVNRLVLDGLPALFGERTTHQVEQSDSLGEILKDEPWPPTPGDIQQQTPIIEDPILEQMLEDAFQRHYGNVEQSATASHLDPIQESSDWETVPALEQADTAPPTASSLSDTAHGHLLRLDELQGW